jgi:hypothetical protein
MVKKSIEKRNMERRMIMAFGIMKRISPEYVLKNAIEDMRLSGLDGLKPYLTSNALKTIDTVSTISSGVDVLTGSLGMFMSQSGSGNASVPSAGFLLDKLSELDWVIMDVLKGSDSAKGVLGFTYQDKVEGTVEVTLIREDKEWRIDTLNKPKFTKFELSNSGNA